MTTAWNSAGDLVNGVSGVVKSAFLRGSSEKSDISFAENAMPIAEGVYKTEVGEYIPLEADVYSDANTVIDTSPHPCPDGTYLNAENTCMYLETEEYDFGNDANMVAPVIDTSPVPCPEGTYLNAENTCMLLETEQADFAAIPSIETDEASTFDFAVNPATQCPEGFTLNADNSCMYLGAELQTKL